MNSLCRILLAFLIIACIVAPIVYYSVRNKHANGDASSNERKPYSSLHSMNWCGDRPVIALTFDDGPEPSTTPNVLADLKRLGIKATFFMSPAVDGEPTQQQCDLVKTVVDEGHVVQSHSYDHTDFLLKSPEEVDDNLSRNEEWIRKCAGQDAPVVSMFRPPYGNLEPARAKYISGLGYDIVTWTIDTDDYTGIKPDRILANVQKGFTALNGNGSAILLMHDKRYKEGQAAGSLELIHQYFTGLGYSFVTMDECRKMCTDPVCQTPGRIWPGVYDQPF
ncbi:NodB homology domain-containing protein [Plasmodiophora brassicae]|uniref:NodB homology domain-containing protein n=1 Tax=Plasmodiophora brassicae TaxID=37360 RepID=A0A0G4J399_PLABS|nr:hypothetical protein PBRA_002272 [Plasmodiophora brassicae]SPQ98861.1 unnamed protein product [Plasmodiophora brassicae]